MTPRFFEDDRPLTVDKLSGIVLHLPGQASDGSTAVQYSCQLKAIDTKLRNMGVDFRAKTHVV